MRISILIITCVLVLGRPINVNAARITVAAEVSTETLRLVPQGAPAMEEGRIYYDSAQNNFKVCNGSGWQVMGGSADNKAATIVVAAYNSRGSVKPGTSTPCDGNGAACDNPKADITCTGGNDGTVISCAIESLWATGGTVYLLEGVYNNNGIQFSTGDTGCGSHVDNNISLIGSGPGTVLRQTSQFITGIGVYAGENILVSSMALSGSGLSSLTAIGIYNAGTKNCIFDNISINRGDIVIRNANGNRISNIDITGGSIRLESSSNNIITRNSIFSGTGIYLAHPESNNPSSYNIITHNRIKNCGPAAFHIGVDPYGNETGSSNNYNIIAYNHIAENTSYGIVQTISQVRIHGSSCNNISYNTISDYNFGNGLRLYPYNSDQGTCVPSSSIIAGNRISKNLFWGIHLDGCSDSYNIVSDNLLMDNAQIFEEGEETTEWAGEIRSSSSHYNLISGNFLFQEPLDAYTHLGLYIYQSRNNYTPGNYCHYSLGSRTLSTGDMVASTGIDRLTLEPGSYTGLVSGGTLTPIGPVSYLRLDPGSMGINVNGIVPGGGVGSILILEGRRDDGSAGIPNGHGTGTLLGTGMTLIPLNNRDTLFLIWDGNRWVQLGYFNNYGG